MATLYDRVKETSTTTGTGDITLAGVASAGGFQRWQDTVGVGNTDVYCIENVAANEWETGLGTLSAATTLQRTTVHASSNGGSLVNFSAGTKNVFVDADANFLNSLGGGSVTSVSNSDGSLTISPTTGIVVASINVAHANKIGRASCRERVW